MRELSLVELDLIVGGYDQQSYDVGGYDFAASGDSTYTGEVSQADYDAQSAQATSDWGVGIEGTVTNTGWGVKVTVSKKS